VLFSLKVGLTAEIIYINAIHPPDRGAGNCLHSKLTAKNIIVVSDFKKFSRMLFESGIVIFKFHIFSPEHKIFHFAKISYFL
jgi:hypothetical protein